MVQETGGRGLNALTARLGSYKPGNASRDFYRNVPMPLERAVGGWRLVRTDNSTYIYIYIYRYHHGGYFQSELQV